MTWSRDLVQSTAPPYYYLFHSTLLLFYFIVTSLIILTLALSGMEILYIFKLQYDCQLARKNYSEICIFLDLVMMEQKNVHKKSYRISYREVLHVTTDQMQPVLTFRMSTLTSSRLSPSNGGLVSFQAFLVCQKTRLLLGFSCMVEALSFLYGGNLSSLWDGNSRV